MKVKLELVMWEEPDGRKFLNFWDYVGGEDVCCQIVDDKLLRIDYDERFEGRQEITLTEFVEEVERVTTGWKNDKDKNS